MLITRRVLRVTWGGWDGRGAGGGRGEAEEK